MFSTLKIFLISDINQGNAFPYFDIHDFYKKHVLKETYINVQKSRNFYNLHMYILF